MSVIGPHVQLVRGSPRRNAFFTDLKENDFDAIKDAAVFSMKLHQPKAEDALVACGAALQKGKPSLYWVEDRKQLPWFLREADLTFPHQVTIVERDGALRLPQGPAPQPKPVETYDTFIGCLMSGLTEEQYKEGRAHLQAIDKALDSKNYCEGIKVGSTASFDTPRESLAQDIRAVQGSKNCVFYAYDGQSRPSGMWVEAGYAIESGKQCTFLVPNQECLPPVLRPDGSLPDNVNVIFYGDHTRLLQNLHVFLQDV